MIIPAKPALLAGGMQPLTLSLLRIRRMKFFRASTVTNRLTSFTRTLTAPRLSDTAFWVTAFSALTAVFGSIAFL